MRKLNIKRYVKSLWTKEFVEYIHSKGLFAKVTTNNATVELVNSLFAIGTDFIMVDQIEPLDLAL